MNEGEAGVGGDFVGRGVAFPMRVDHSGAIALIGGAEQIQASLRMVLDTAPGERTMRPRFGCAIWDQVFSPINPNTLGLMAEAVREAIGRWEPRVELEDVTVDAVEGDDGQGHVVIDIAYRERATNDRRNLVYPFYVIPREAGS